MSSAWNHLHGFERLSLCDWPGYSSCVVFLGGCNMRCPTCHNWQLAWHADTLPVLSRAAVEAYIEARRHWLDGVVVTGGKRPWSRASPTCSATCAASACP